MSKVITCDYCLSKETELIYCDLCKTQQNKMSSVIVVCVNHKEIGLTKIKKEGKKHGLCRNSKKSKT